jgi:hypothetical protein
MSSASTLSSSTAELGLPPVLGDGGQPQQALLNPADAEQAMARTVRKIRVGARMS